MKKISLVSIAIVLCSIYANGQERTPSKFGLQAGYGNEIEEYSFGINAEFFAPKILSIAPGVAFYMPRKEGSGSTKVVTTFSN